MGKNPIVLPRRYANLGNNYLCIYICLRLHKFCTYCRPRNQPRRGLANQSTPTRSPPIPPSPPENRSVMLGPRNATSFSMPELGSFPRNLLSRSPSTNPGSGTFHGTHRLVSPEQSGTGLANATLVCGAEKLWQVENRVNCKRSLCPFRISRLLYAILVWWVEQGARHGQPRIEGQEQNYKNGHRMFDDGARDQQVIVTGRFHPSKRRDRKSVCGDVATEISRLGMGAAHGRVL